MLPWGSIKGEEASTVRPPQITEVMLKLCRTQENSGDLPQDLSRKSQFTLCLGLACWELQNLYPSGAI